MTAPQAVTDLLKALEPLGGSLHAPEDEYDQWTVELSGWITPGVYQVDLDEDGTFSLWLRNWDRTGAISVEQAIESGLDAEQAALHLTVIWRSEKDQHDKLEALMAESDAAWDAAVADAADNRPWEN